MSAESQPSQPSPEEQLRTLREQREDFINSLPPNDILRADGQIVSRFDERIAAIEAELHPKPPAEYSDATPPKKREKSPEDIVAEEAYKALERNLRSRK